MSWYKKFFKRLTTYEYRKVWASLLLTVLLYFLYYFLFPYSSNLEGFIFTVVSFIVVLSSIEYVDSKDFFTRIVKNVSLNEKLNCMNIGEKESVNSCILSMLQKTGLKTYSVSGLTSIAFEVKGFDIPIEENGKLFLIKIIKENYLRNKFTERFSEYEIIGEDHITRADFKDLSEREKIVIIDQAIIWITGFKVSEKSLTLGYELSKYYKKYSLNKHMYCKFPEEETYPIRLLLSNIPAFGEKNYEIIKKLPLSIGCEVSVVTSDNKYIIIQRSHEEAVQRFHLNQAASGAYDDTDLVNQNDIDIKDNTLKGIFYGAKRELRVETGIEEKDIDSFYLLSIAYILSNNGMSFVFLCRTNLTYEQIKTRYITNYTEERWEGRRMLKVDLSDMVSNSVRFQKFIKKYRNLLTDQLIVSIDSTVKYYLSKQ